MSSTRESSISSISSLLQRLTTPLEITVEEDSAATIKSLQMSLIKRLVQATQALSKEKGSVASAIVRAQGEGQLIMVELEEAPVNPMGAAALHGKGATLPF